MRTFDKIWVYLMELGAFTGCHQKPERSFFFKNYQFPVCARCTGIFIVKPFALLYVRTKELSLFKCIILVIPMIIDGVMQYKYSIESNNRRRLLTGLMGGFALCAIRMQIIKLLLQNSGKHHCQVKGEVPESV